jgi:hypothetical protein
MTEITMQYRLRHIMQSRRIDGNRIAPRGYPLEVVKSTAEDRKTTAQTQKSSDNFWIKADFVFMNAPP